MSLSAARHVCRLADGRDGRHGCMRAAARFAVTPAFLTQWVLIVLLACGPLLARADDLDSAIELANEGRYEEAHQRIAPVLDAQPDHFRARLLQGILRAREGRLDDAVRLFEALRDTYPERSEPYNNLAAVYVALNRLEDARGALVAAIARKPDLPTAHENLADLYIRLARRSTLHARGLADAPAPDQDLAPAAPPGEDAPVVAWSDPDAAAAVAAAEDPSPAPSPAPSETAALPPPEACVRVTGLPDAGAAADAITWLESQGAAVQQRQNLTEVIRDHWVYLPPLASEAEASAKLEEMRANGVDDLAVVRHGDRANGISLGVYRSTDNMRRRVAALKDMGYPVQYETTLETVVTYGLEADLSALPPFVRADWAAEFPEFAMETFGCASG